MFRHVPQTFAHRRCIQSAFMGMLKNFAHGRCHQGVGANRLYGPTTKTVAYCICMRSEFKRLPNKFANCRCMQSVFTCNQTVGTSLRFSYSIELPWTRGLILSQIDFFEKPVSKKAKSLLISNEYRSLIFHPNSTKLSGNVQLLQKPLLTNFGEIWKKIVLSNPITPSLPAMTPGHAQFWQRQKIH